MRLIFGVVGLLVVVVIVGVLAKRNLQAVQTATLGPAAAASAQAAAATPQRRIEHDARQALEAGAQRSRDAAEGAK